MILRLRVAEKPGDLDAGAALAEMEAEAGNYPKMKAPRKGPASGTTPTCG